MGQERLDSLSVSTLHWRRHASLSWLWRHDQRFCISKVKQKDFLNCVLHCNCKCMQQGCKRDFSLWISKQYRCPAFKTMYMQFCSEAKSCAYWLVNETLWYETETRPRHLIFSPRRDRDWDLPTFPQDRDETETFGNYVSRPWRRDRDYIPDQMCAQFRGIWSSCWWRCHHWNDCPTHVCLLVWYLKHYTCDGCW